MQNENFVSNISRIPVNSGSPANGSNGRSSDDGSANSSTCSAHRYKFKSNIKQRFTADCQTTEDDHFPQENRGKGSHCEVEGDGDVDVSSDMDEIRDEGMDEPVSKSCRNGGHSGGEELESKLSQPSPCRRASSGERVAHSDEKAGPQISAVGASSSSLEKTAFSSDAPNSSGVDSKNSSLDLENSEVKPTPEELLTAIHNLSSPSHNPQLPAIVGGEPGSPDGKGVPAFVLHEKGLFYVPLTIDKTIVANYVNKHESANAPPLYPVTISVCFVLGPDKKGKLETLHASDSTTADCDKATDFSQSICNPIPLPILPGASTSVMKYNSRRGYRDSSNFIPNRFCHPKQQSSHKESHHHSRGLGNVLTLQF